MEEEKEIPEPSAEDDFMDILFGSQGEDVYDLPRQIDTVGFDSIKLEELGAPEECRILKVDSSHERKDSNISSPSPSPIKQAEDMKPIELTTKPPLLPTWKLPKQQPTSIVEDVSDATARFNTSNSSDH